MTDATAGPELRGEPEYWPLRTTGHVLSVLPAGSVALAAARLVVPALTSGDWPARTATDEGPVVVTSRVVLAVTVIVFLIWFRNARARAEYSSWRQRRARAWVFRGWIIPPATCGFRSS